MPSQNINNYYFNRYDIKLDYSSYFDLTLASDERDYDEEVVFSNDIIGVDDGNRLPVSIDLNSFLSNQKLDLLWNVNYSGNTLISKNYYNPNNEDLSCKTATTVCDIGLVGTDNGLYDKMSGQSLTFTMGINDFEKKYELNEIVSGDSIFCATAITSGDLAKGIIVNENSYSSETLITHKSSGLKKIYKSTNKI